MRLGILVLSLLMHGFAIAMPLDNSDALIQIGVEVVEVNELKAQDLGIEWINTLRISEVDVPSFFKIGTLTRSALYADLHVLMQEGAADLLANPKLVARNGTTATFHAGGELPYATSSTLGATSVEFKPYGVKLQIEPKINKHGQISLTIEAEVSSPDNNTGVSLAGNTVPGLRTRSVTSQLTLDAGSTLTLAGLLQSEKEWKRVGVPGLMHVPLLKYLFSRKTQMNRKTSIIVFLTPTILDMGILPTPVIPKSPQVGLRDPLLEALDDAEKIHG